MPLDGKTTVILVLVMFRDIQFSRTPDIIWNLQKKKFVSNGNEVKNAGSREPMAHWPPAINPFATILLSQICWDFLFVSYSPSFFSSKISPIDWLTSLHCAPSLREAQILLERWRHHYNTVRPLSAIGYRPPAPESIITLDQKPTMH